MLINNLLASFQNAFKPVYEKSYFLQKIDWLILVNILLVMFTSTCAQSDSIGYFAIFAIILTVIKLFTKAGEKFELSLADKFLLVYFLVVLISVAGSSLLYLSLKGFFKTFIYLGFYVSLVHYFKDNIDKIKYVFLAFAAALSFEAIIAFLQNFSSVGEISGWQDTSRLNPEEVMTRVYGTLKPYNPNLFGGYMLSCLPCFLALPFINKKFLIWALTGGVLSSIALVLTGCRGAYIGFFFEAVVLVCITYKFLKPVYKKMFGTVVALGAVLLSFVVVSISALRARIFSIFAMRSDSSNSFRFNVYNSCIDMFKDNWLLGIGVGNQNFREIYGLYMKTGFDALSAYNIYLEIAVESGVFALVAFVGFIGVNVFKAVNYVFRFITSPQPSPVRRGGTRVIYVACALVSIVGILFHGIVDTVFFRPQIQFTFWIMVAIIRVITAESVLGIYDKREN